MDHVVSCSKLINTRMKAREIVAENRGGNCFEVAGNAMIHSDMPGLKLVHAYVSGQGRLEGKRFLHAWNEMGDVVIDKSNGNNIVMRKEQYYDLGKVSTAPGEYATYDSKQAIDKMVETKHYGPWDLDETKTQDFTTEHTIRDGIDIVQQSQSCSIYESDFDPKPIPKVADLQQSGNPDAEKIADATVKYVTENCQPWLQSIKPNQVVYRGILVQSNQESEDLVFTRAVRSNRLPRNSSDALHEFYNKIIDMAGGVANRSNSASVAGSKSFAQGFGSLFVVMPVGEFHYTWSPYAEDWYNTFYLDLSLDLLFSQEEFKQEVDLEKKWQQHKEKYPESTDKEGCFRGVYRNWYFNKIENYDTDNLDQTYLHGMIKADTGLPKAIESGNEIMISASKMLYIEEGFYEDYVIPAYWQNKNT